jgi:hypothetical protein
VVEELVVLMVGVRHKAEQQILAVVVAELAVIILQMILAAMVAQA